MSSANPLPETCHVYLDLSPLPLQSDGSADLVALSPFTITWGVSNPWDDITPNVLKITLIDQADRFSKSGDLLMGHRLTISPDWGNTATPVNFCLFDGYVTDVQILDHDGGRNRLSVTASDRIYILKTDCRQGPHEHLCKHGARLAMVDARADGRNGAEVAVLRRRAKLLVAVEYFPHAIQRGTAQELHRLGAKL